MNDDKCLAVLGKNEYMSALTLEYRIENLNKVRV